MESGDWGCLDRCEVRDGQARAGLDVDIGRLDTHSIGSLGSSLADTSSLVRLMRFHVASSG